MDRLIWDSGTIWPNDGALLALVRQLSVEIRPGVYEAHIDAIAGDLDEYPALERLLQFVRAISSNPGNAQALEDAADNMQKTWLGRMSPGMLVLLLVALFMVVAPAGLLLPPKGQALVNSEMAALGVALALAPLILDKRNKDD